MDHSRCLRVPVAACACCLSDAREAFNSGFEVAHAEGGVRRAGRCDLRCLSSQLQFGIGGQPRVQQRVVQAQLAREADDENISRAAAEREDRRRGR